MLLTTLLAAALFASLVLPVPANATIATIATIAIYMLLFVLAASGGQFMVALGDSGEDRLG